MIPKRIHQTFSSQNDIHPEIKQLQTIMKEVNPDWKYSFYDDYECSRFIRDLYGNEVLKAWSSINPKYGAVKADLFRYLVIYELGGLYLDIKSCAVKHLDDLISDDDTYFISFWDQSKHGGAGFPGMNMWPQDSILRQKGEIQQWYIMAEPKHKYIKLMIRNTLENIRAYDPSRHGVGLFGALTVSGPIMYSLTLLPYLNDFEGRIVDSAKDLGLMYAPLGRYHHHNLFNKEHYSNLKEPVVFNANLVSRA